MWQQTKPSIQFLTFAKGKGHSHEGADEDDDNTQQQHTIQPASQLKSCAIAKRGM